MRPLINWSQRRQINSTFYEMPLQQIGDDNEIRDIFRFKIFYFTFWLKIKFDFIGKLVNVFLFTYVHVRGKTQAIFTYVNT